MSAEQEDSDYQTILAVVPGDVLMDVYGEYGSRLLQLNVRSFLQARGKVNQGIRRTILDEPDRFLAYNNGISATASAVKLTSMPEGGLGIQSLDNLQIVNGGQTTASLYHAAVKDRANIDHVQVQMKLTVVEPDRLDEIVPLISRYANSQNKVNEADFSANHPFHVEIERLSRAIWAPAADGTQRQTRWFYERARGQYQDALSRAGTPARQRQFKETHPAAQRFAKTDLAKFEMAWDRLPHLVSLGAQKCFREFTIRLTDRADQSVDQAYFANLIAKAILFRRTEKLVSSLQLGGYRANVVAYVVALLSERSKRQLDLAAIWRHQRLSANLEDAILDLAPRVHGILLEAPGNGNVTEWAKKPACWERVHGMAWQLPVAVTRELTSTGSAPNGRLTASAAEVAGLPADVWSRLADWAQSTDQLAPLDRRIAVGMSTLARSGQHANPQAGRDGIPHLSVGGSQGIPSRARDLNTMDPDITGNAHEPNTFLLWNDDPRLRNVLTPELLPEKAGLHDLSEFLSDPVRHEELKSCVAALYDELARQEDPDAGGGCRWISCRRPT